MPPKPAAWKPENDEKPLTMQEFLALAEQKHPGISRHPQLRQALTADLQKAVSLLPPVRARANARLRGYAPSLTDAQHTQAIKAHTGVRTYHRKNPGAGGDERALRALFRRNAAYAVDAVNAWKTATASIYQSNDLPLLAAREALQNGVDAIRQAVKKKQIRQGEGLFEIVFSPEGRWLEFRDNGTGMTRDIIKTFLTLNQSGEEKRATVDPGITLKVRRYKRTDDDGSYYFRLNGLFQFLQEKRGSQNKLPYDYVFDYATPGTTGGFGMAKAVILGASNPGPKWTLRTQDMRYTSEMADADPMGQPQPETGLPYHQGTILRIENIGMIDSVKIEKKSYDGYPYWVQEDPRPLSERIRTMLAANDVPDVTLKFNGVVVEPFFSGRQGRIVESPLLTGLTGGSGLAGTPNYPLNQGRDRFNDRATERAFLEFAESVETEPTIKTDKADELYDPGLSAGTRPADQRAVEDTLNNALSSPDIKALLSKGAEAANKIAQVSFVGGLGRLASQGAKATREGESRSTAPATPVPEAVTSMTQATKVAEELAKASSAAQGKKNPDTAKKIAALLLRALNDYENNARAQGLPTISWLPYETVLTNISNSGYFYNPERDLTTLYSVLAEVAKGASATNGGGLSVVASVQGSIEGLIEAAGEDPYFVDQAKAQAQNPNPFGTFAGLLISRQQFLTAEGKYNSAGARNFKKNYTKYLPLLIVWDQILRLIASANRMKKPFYPGFVLNDDVLAVMAPLPSGSAMLAINPLLFRNYAKAAENAQEIALRLHAHACHEMAHLVRGSGHKDGHDERFVIQREELAAVSFSLIPGMTLLVHNILGYDLPRGFGKGAEATQRVKALEAQLAAGCQACYKDLVQNLEATGRVDTVTWLRAKAEDSRTGEPPDDDGYDDGGDEE
jgi:hypothetical protein